MPVPAADLQDKRTAAAFISFSQEVSAPYRKATLFYGSLPWRCSTLHFGRPAPGIGLCLNRLNMALKLYYILRIFYSIMVIQLRYRSDT